MAFAAHAIPLAGRDPAVVRRRLAALARLLDSAVGVPGTRVRFGLDTVLGVVPVAGNVITTALSAYIIAEAARLGVPPAILVRMAANVAIDALLSAIPAAGIVLDTVMRANLRNVALLDEHLGGAGRRDPFDSGSPIDVRVVERT
jgi:hypothetical protein